ncbi:MAG: heparinase II/III domain-containing protein [Armatimonadota bacterium]
METNRFLAELCRRAAMYAKATRLTVNYYRIRRKVSYPLPPDDRINITLPLPFGGHYPWETWLAWEWEQRIYSLGSAGDLLGEFRWRALADADVRHMTAWQRYGAPAGLTVGHFVRTMLTGLQQWHWLSTETQMAIRDRMYWLIDEYLHWLSVECQLDHVPDMAVDEQNRNRILNNIRFIALLSFDRAAASIEHPAAEMIHRYTVSLTRYALDAHADSYTETVAYDGYVLDFIADWLPILTAPERDELLSHPSLSGWLAQSWHLGAPGCLPNVAQIGDVEPRAMPFHLSAHAKLRLLPTSDWLLGQCPVDWLRSDALASLVSRSLKHVAPPQAGEDAVNMALTSRSGWTHDDLAVVLSCHACETGHLHRDNGTIAIGVGNEWLIDDPGYQQYLDTTERTFTLAPEAHNAPVINGHGQMRNAGRRLHVDHIAVDLLACYPVALGLTRIERHLWRLDTHGVLVADCFGGALDDAMIGYFWHGHPDAAWYAEDGIAILTLNAYHLWCRCLHTDVGFDNICRRSGSRGHLTLEVRIPASINTIWWCFSRDRGLLMDAAVNPVNRQCVHYAGQTFRC